MKPMLAKVSPIAAAASARAECVTETCGNTCPTIVYVGWNMRSIVAMTFTSPEGSTRIHAEGDPRTIAAAASMIAPLCLTPCISTKHQRCDALSQRSSIHDVHQQAH